MFLLYSSYILLLLQVLNQVGITYPIHLTSFPLLDELWSANSTNILQSARVHASAYAFVRTKP